jgi:hypothetical protein
MGWRYQDLTEEEKEKIVVTLPDNWEYGGKPGDKIWPIFQCPYCGEGCESEWGGCNHLMYIFRGSGSDGFSDYLHDLFPQLVKDRLTNKYRIKNIDWEDYDDFPSPHSPLAESMGKELFLDEIYPELKIIVFNASYSFYDFVDYAGFIEDL